MTTTEQTTVEEGAPAGESPEARFHFVSKDLRLEFSGSPEYVNGQVDFFRAAIRRALGYAESDAGASRSPAGTGPGAGNARPPAAGEEGSGRSALDEFLRKVRTRVGRGALQERILLFIYYLTEVKGRAEVGTEDINFCFDLLGLERPKSLANTLGIMKRNQALLNSGGRRGTYTCTEKGRGQVQGLLLG